jgi:sialidase-1
MTDLKKETRQMSNQEHGIAVGVGIVCVAALLLAGCSATEGLTATVIQPVHPVLIRNDQNVMLQLVIDSKRSAPAQLQSIEFSLEGTDDLNDLEALEVFPAGAKPEFAAEARFGKSAQPSAKVSFRGNQQLQTGANVFWLSCRLKPTADLSHKVAATVSSIGVSGGTLAPTGQPAAVRRRIGIALRKHNDDNVHTYRIPSLATGPKGTLYSVYDMRRRKSRDLQEDIDIGLSRSTDGGRSWEPVKVVMDMGEYGKKPPEENGVSDPGIVVDQKT